MGAHPASPPVPLVPPLPRRAGANRRGAAGARRPRRQDAVGLPPGLTCIRFVVQWYWATANSCTPGMGAYAFPVACGDCPVLAPLTPLLFSLGATAAAAPFLPR